MGGRCLKEREKVWRYSCAFPYQTIYLPLTSIPFGTETQNLPLTHARRIIYILRTGRRANVVPIFIEKTHKVSKIGRFRTETEEGLSRTSTSDVEQHEKPRALLPESPAYRVLK